MSTRSSAKNLFLPLDNTEITIRRRSRTDPTLLNNFEMAAERNGDIPVPDVRTMEELCQPSLNGRCGPISPIAIQATNFGIKSDMIQQSIKVNGVTDDVLRLYLFPHSLTHHATAWFDRLPRNSINTFEQMAKMFLGKYFLPYMVTKLRNEITNFRQRPDESLFKAWERYKLSIDRCPNHNMLPVTQIDTFYNGLTLRHRDTINAAAGGTFMKRRLEECYDLIENMTAHHNDWGTSAQRTTVVNTQNVYVAGAYQGYSYQPQGNRNLLNYRSDNYLGPPGNNQGRNQFFQGANQSQNPPPAYQAPAYQASGYQAPVHQPQIPQPQVVTTNEFINFMKANDAILKNMQTNITSLINSNLELKNMFGQFIKMNTASSSGSETIPGNTITNPMEDLKGITTRSGTEYQGPTIPTTSSCSPVVERETEATKDTVHPTNNGSTKDVQPSVVQTESLILNSEPVVAPIIEPVASLVSAPNQRPSIPYPSRLHDQKLRDKANDQRVKFFQIFKDLNFNISFADALILMPKFGPSIKSLLTNKDKLLELARTPLNEHCLAVLLKKLPENLGDPGKFLIPCDFPRMAECLTLADLDASINLMPLSVWNKIFLPDFSPTCMTLELTNRSISRPFRAVEDVFVKVGQSRYHQFPEELIACKTSLDLSQNEIASLKRSRSTTRPAGIAEDVFVIVGKFHFPTDFVVVDYVVDPRVPLILERPFLRNIRALIDVYGDELTLRVDDEAITFKLVKSTLKKFFEFFVSGNPTPFMKPIVSTSSPTLTLFGDSDFLFEETDAFLATEDEPILSKIDDSYYDSKEYILLLEEFLNDDPSSPPLPSQELKVVEPKNEKSSIDEPTVVELMDLPPHLEYAFLEGDDKLPVMIAKD
nr:reverse transcriptase domain-containing protein [Tanacetum cinerariifolium]